MSESFTKVALDTNILLLWLVAQTDPNLLQEFKRVQEFTYQDIELLRNLLSHRPKFITTPHVLSETSNYVRQAPQHRRPELTQALCSFINDASEIFEASEELSKHREFRPLGLTDTALLHLSDRATVLTTDYELSSKIQALGRSARNFNHERTYLMAD